MRRLILPVVAGLATLAACSSAPVRQPGETDAGCIHRLYDYPTRSEPFQTAASECAGNRTVDLTGDRYFQVLASSLNVPFINRASKQDSTITLTGSRLPQSTAEPPPPELSLR